jgi:hypothetical protein
MEDVSFLSVKGVGTKVKWYLRQMHPQFALKSTTVGEFLRLYPEYAALEAAIKSGDTNIPTGALNTIRKNMQVAYQYMNSLSRDSTQKAGGSPEAPLAPGAEETSRLALKRPREETVGDVVLPAEKRPKGDISQLRPAPEEKLSEGVFNTETAAATHTLQALNYPLIDAAAEEKGNQEAREEPIKQSLQLTMIPDAFEASKLTQQEQNQLEHRNASELLKTTILPAAALVPGDAKGVREGRDLEREKEEVPMELEEEEIPGIKAPPRSGGSRVSARASSTRKVEEGAASTISRQMRKVDSRVATGGINYLAQLMHGATPLLGGYLGGAEGAAFANLYVKPIIEGGANLAKNVVGAAIDLNAKRTQAAAQFPDEGRDRAMQRYMERQTMTQGQTQLEREGRPETYDELRPFLPIAGTADAELRPGDVRNKAMTAALFNNYKPPNWPLGGPMDNALHFQNLVLQGIHWESPLDAIPAVLPGASLNSVVPFGEIQEEPYIPSLMVAEKQIMFKMGKHGKDIVARMKRNNSAPLRSEIVYGDTKFIHNASAMGVDSSMELSRNLMNPLFSELTPDLQIDGGGKMELRPLIPECDAFTMQYQIGAEPKFPAIPANYTRSENFNRFSMYPGTF